MSSDVIVYVYRLDRVNRAMVIACLVKSVAFVMIITRQVIAIDVRAGSSPCCVLCRLSRKRLLSFSISDDVVHTGGNTRVQSWIDDVRGIGIVGDAKNMSSSEICQDQGNRILFLS